jgi:hypothetical protein
MFGMLAQCCSGLFAEPKGLSYAKLLFLPKFSRLFAELEGLSYPKLLLLPSL